MRYKNFAATIGSSIGMYVLQKYISPFFHCLYYDMPILLLLPQLLKEMVKLSKSNKTCADIFEDSVRSSPDKTFVIFEEQKYSYRFMDTMANKVAHLALSLGLKTRDTASIMVTNTPDFIWIFYGFQKLRIEVALINYNLQMDGLVYCIKLCTPHVFIVDKDPKVVSTVKDVLDKLDDLPVYALGSKEMLPAGFLPFDELLRNAQSTSVSPDIRRSLSMDGISCYIFISGTTGMQKASSLDHYKITLLGLVNAFLNFTT